MKSKVLKLCKRLNKVTIDEITPILLATRGEICPVLDELVMEGRLELRSDGTYFYKKVEVKKTNLPLFFEFRTKEELDLIVKCFCLKIATEKTGILLNLSDVMPIKFYKYFRKIIYTTQFEKLKDFYNQNPYTPRIRTFFDKQIYFYYYNGRTFVSENQLKTDKQENTLPRCDDLKFRKTYLKLTRKINHNKMANYLHLYIAEELWRMDKDFSTLHYEITELCS